MLLDPGINEGKVNELFELCKNRMNISYYKYGSAKDNFGSGRVDAYKTADLCLEKFRKTKNTEYLLDVINYCIFRILYPMPDEVFKATDSGESAGTVGTPINMEKGE